MGLISNYQTGKFLIFLTKPFPKWEEVKNGQMNPDGSLVKGKKIDSFMNLIRKVKLILLKFIKNESLLSTVALSVWFLKEDVTNQNLNIPEIECLFETELNQFEKDMLQDVKAIMEDAGMAITEAYPHFTRLMQDIHKDIDENLQEENKPKMKMKSFKEFIADKGVTL